MTATFTTVPIADGEPSPLDQGKRKRPELSRDQKDRLNAAARERRARKGTRPRARAKTASGPKSLAPEIAAFLTMANMLVIMTPLGTRPVAAIYDPAVPLEHLGDELDDGEIKSLASALDAQCRRSPRFKKYVERVLGVGSGGALITVLGMIAARRLARHGVIPNGDVVDYSLGVTLAQGGDMLNFEPPTPHDPTPDPNTDEVAPNRTDDIDFDNIDLSDRAASGK